MTERAILRRDLLTGVALAAGALGGCSAAPEGGAPSAAPPAAPPDEWGIIRGEFELSREWIQLCNFLLASHPRAVREAIAKHRRELDENPVAYLAANEHLSTAVERVLGIAGSYMGVPSTEIALTDSTTMSLALLYHGLALRPGDEIVTTNHDHYATHEALRLVAQRTGALVRKVALYEQPSAATTSAMVEAIVRAITPATRVVAVTWVHSCTGVKIPVRAIADARGRGQRRARAGRHGAAVRRRRARLRRGGRDDERSRLRLLRRPGPTSGSSARAEPACCGARPRAGRACGPRSRASASRPTCRG